MSEPTEHAIQCDLIKWRDVAVVEFPELALLYAIPNGGKRDKATAGKMKAEGVRAGVPDLCLPVKRGQIGALYIEMKTERGQLSLIQLKMHRDLIAAGNAVVVCRSWHDAAATILYYLGADAETVQRLTGQPAPVAPAPLPTKRYIAMDKYGHEHSTGNLKAFCVEHELQMTPLLRGEYPDWDVWPDPAPWGSV